MRSFLTGFRTVFLASILLIFSVESWPHTCAIPRDAHGKIARSKAEIAKFKRANSCPATGKTTGSCAGYVIDHIFPLCACGDDLAANMQWQGVVEAKKKDLLEIAYCKKVNSPPR